MQKVAGSKPRTFFFYESVQVLSFLSVLSVCKYIFIPTSCICFLQILLVSYMFLQILLVSYMFLQILLVSYMFLQVLLVSYMFLQILLVSYVVASQ